MKKSLLKLLQNSLEPLSFERFVNLFEEYYLSDNPSDLGNFVNGVLEFKFDNIQVGKIMITRCFKLSIYNPYIFRTRCRTPTMFQTMNSVKSSLEISNVYTIRLGLENLSLWENSVFIIAKCKINVIDRNLEIESSTYQSTVLSWEFSAENTTQRT